MGPLTRAVREYIDGDFSRFHTPGHKGVGGGDNTWGDLWRWDVTECAGLDSLFEAEGPIRATERAYSRLYGTVDSLISAGGSTLCIQAMLALALSPGEELLAVRGVHGSTVNAMALLDLRPAWLLPGTDQATGLAGAVTPRQVEEGLARHPAARAVYLTSPTYFGAMAEIAAIARICKARRVPLLVDNAHGAHLAFLPENRHPVALGAELCCDSLHKTLPVLTGGAMLHVGSGKYAPRAREKLALFGSTSPSYPIMLSIDGALDYLEQHLRDDAPRVSRRLEAAAEAARAKGLLLPDYPLRDPWRLTLGGAPLGLDGPGLGAYLRGWRIEPEMITGRFCVLMASGRNRQGDFDRLEQAVAHLEAKGPPLALREAALTLPEQACSVREAVFAPSERVPAEEAAGRIAGSVVCPCPPGIAVLVPGERIDENTARLLKGYGILTVNVVR